MDVALVVGILEVRPKGEFEAGGFGVLDWLVLGGYGLLLLITGWWLNRKKARNAQEEYFLGKGGQRSGLPSWVVAISMLATVQSAATFVGAPEQSFRGDLTYLGGILGSILASLVVAIVFVPRYYKLGVATPYELLEHRYGVGARRAGAVAYLVGRMLANGVRVYIGALFASLMLFGKADVWTLGASIGLFMAFGALFTLGGGLRAAIWSDVVQVGVYLTSAVVLGAVVVWMLKSEGRLADLQELAAAGKMRFIDLGWRDGGNGSGGGFDWGADFSLPGIIIGLTLLNTAFFAMDQDLTQRLLACKDSRSAIRGLVMSTVVVSLPVVILFVALGLLMWVYFYGSGAGEVHRSLLSASQGSDESTRAIVRFALHVAPAGVAGLVLAGLLAAGPGGINSSLNSMASSFVADLYKPMMAGQGDLHYVVVGKWATVIAAVVMAGFAIVCVVLREQQSQTLIGFAIGVMSYAYAGLLGVFFCAVACTRGNVISVICAMIVGAVVVGVMQFGPRIEGYPFAQTAGGWQLAVGGAAAFFVCMLGKGKAAR
jgi:solute:Na+ symporter, SSS family